MSEFITRSRAYAIAAPLLIFSPNANAQPAAIPRNVTAANATQEIVVTAQRREERLQDVPISVVAITADLAAARGITEVTSIQQAVPGLSLNMQANAQTPFLRGIGTNAGAVGNEPAVALYVDNIYISSAQATWFKFNNIERVEVLRGPQGTLFGRNATGGVINIVTSNPTNDPILKAEAGYGNFQTYTGSLYASTGLSEDIAVSLAAYGQKQNEGWGRNLTNGKEVWKGWDWSLRPKLRVNVGDRANALFTAYYGRSNSGVGNNSTIHPGTLGPDRVSTFQGHFSPQGDPIDFSLMERWGGSFRFEYEFDWATVVNLASYGRWKTDYSFDQDRTGANIVLVYPVNQSGKTWTEELQLISPKGDKFNWIVGLYYLNDTGRYDPLSVSAGTPFQIISNRYGTTTTKSIAGYAQADYEILPRTKLTLGARYTRDRKGVLGFFTDGSGTLTPGSFGDQSQTFNKMTFRAALDHRFSDNVMAYASFNRGYKSGQFQILAATAPSVEPEIIDAYEAGFKTDLIDRTLRFNMTGFYYDYTNIQVVVSPVPGLSVFTNAGRARVYGGELEMVAQPSRNLSFSGSVSYVNGKYTSFPNGPTVILNPGTCDLDPGAPGNQPGQLPGPRTGNGIQCFTDLSGNRLIHSPRITSSWSIDWRIPAGTTGEFALRANLYTNSGFFWEADNQARQKAYELANASLQWTEPGERYYARVWARNIFNVYHSNYSTIGTVGHFDTPAEPRVYGLTLGYNWGG